MRPITDPEHRRHAKNGEGDGACLAADDDGASGGVVQSLAQRVEDRA